MKKIILIDGNSLMFRAYYATAYTGNLMQARSGIYTNAIYGFVNMINKVLETDYLTNIFVAFDKGKNTLRHQQYDEYKGGRKSMPEEFAMQIPLIKEYLDVMRIAQFECDDYEADDLIAMVATKSVPQFDEILILSGDKDLLQLVGGNITVGLTKKGITELEYYNENNFEDIMGFKPEQMTDYKGLIGDSSDNLPGISGVGPKTAIKLLKEFGTLENIIANASIIKGKLGETISEESKIALKTKQLATLYKNAEVTGCPSVTGLSKPDYQKLRQFYEKVDFKSFIKKMPINELGLTDKKVDIKKIDRIYYYNDFLMFSEFCQMGYFNDAVIEVELAGENYHKSDLLGLSIVSVNGGFFFDKMFLYDDLISHFFEQIANNIYTVNIKRTVVALAKIGITIKSTCFDLLLASYIINPSFASDDPRVVLANFTDTELPYMEEIYGKKTSYQIPELQLLTKYAIDKGYEVLEVNAQIITKLKEIDCLDLLEQMEIPLAFTLAEMEISGMMIDPKRLEEIGSFLQAQLKELEKRIYHLAGEEFNISSPKQLGVILFDKLQLGKGKKNKNGYSTNAEILEKLASIHEVPRLVLEYRKYSKLMSTYVTGLINEINPLTQKIHTTYKQALTLTGRLSSTEPNIQNIPIRTEDGRLIRSAFIPSNKDGYIVSADYSQIELRILAHVSNCQAMIDDFNAGMDFHSTTAAKIYDISLDSVTKDARRVAKAVNFGIVYGMSDWGLSEQLHISPTSANNFIKKYFEIYPEIKKYLESSVEEAKKLGYSQTLFNRRRYMPEINSSNRSLRQFAERTAMNAPIQGAAADIIKYAMNNVLKKMHELRLKSKMIATVHDELIIDCCHDELAVVKKILKEQMENVTDLKVKLEVEVQVGKTWDLK